MDSETEEATAVEPEPVGLPDFLARRADALSESAESGAGDPTPSEVTSIERQPVGLPDFLARRADEAGAEGEDAETRESELNGHTLHEKLPPALPGMLARRSEQAAGEARKPEMVDLADIEELIASEEEVVEPGAGTTEGLQLIVAEFDGGVRRMPLAQGENVVGRGSGADVMLEYPDLSRNHASLTVAGEKVTLRDLGSRNRTFADGLPIDAEVDVEVRPGARLRFGSIEAILAKVEVD